MSEASEPLAVIGGLVEHAESLQAQAAEVLRLVQAESAASKKNIEALLSGLAVVAKSFGAQQAEMQRQLQAFREAAGQLGAQAFAGGQAAVSGEVRAALNDAGAIVGAVAAESTAPARDAMAMSVAALNASRASLAETQRRLSWRALAVTGAALIGALAIAALGGAGFVAWQRHEVESARGELSELQSRAANLTGIIAEMEKKGRELDARGVRFDTSRCGESAGKARLCVAVDPDAPDYMSADKTKKYRVPLGF